MLNMQRITAHILKISYDRLKIEIQLGGTLSPKSETKHYDLFQFKAQKNENDRKKFVRCSENTSPTL